MNRIKILRDIERFSNRKKNDFKNRYFWLQFYKSMNLRVNNQ